MFFYIQKNAEAFVSYGFLTVVMYQQLVQTSFIFELIGSKVILYNDKIFLLYKKEY